MTEHDGSNPLTEALGDTGQKGAALAAIAMQLLTQRRREAMSRGQSQTGPGAHVPGVDRESSDYLLASRGWNRAFQPGLDQADGRAATQLWLSAAEHRGVLPSAEEAMQLAGRRMRQLDPALMDRVDRLRAGETPAAVALERASREQLQLPQGRGSEARLAAAEFELARAQREHQALVNDAGANSQVVAEHRASTLQPAQQLVRSVREELGVDGMDTPAAPGSQLAQSAEQRGLGAGAQAEAHAAAGLAADEGHAGVVMTGAVDRLETPANERTEAYDSSGERFQVAEAGQAKAASLASLSYPHKVQATISAVQQGGPAPPRPGTQVVQQPKRLRTL